MTDIELPDWVVVESRHGRAALGQQRFIAIPSCS